MTRKLGVSLGCYGGLQLDEQISMMKKYGFEACFTGSENPNLDSIIPALKDAGISCDNFHAPFNKINDIWKPGEEGDDMAARLYRSVEKAAFHGVPAIVVHLSSGLNPPHVNDVGCARWAKLMEIAKEANVLICYENQRMLSNLAFAFEEFPETARFCWDCGHEFCFTPGRHYMPIFGHKLSALHIHDNHCVFNKDEHLIPGDGSIDFGYIAAQIVESGYTGTVMLELIRKNSDLYPDWTADRYYEHAAAAGKKLIADIDAIENKSQKE